jgi:hypothetical protein
VRCWFAPHDIQSGKKLHEQIDEAIRLHDKLLLILSPHSMQSEWVKTEADERFCAARTSHLDGEVRRPAHGFCRRNAGSSRSMQRLEHDSHHRS